MLDKGFNEVATVIDMQKHIDGRNRSKGLFSKSDRKMLAELDRFGSSYKIMKDMEFKPPKARQSETGERALLYLAATPHVPMFEIAKQQESAGYVLRQGYFKEPRYYRDLSMLVRHVRHAIKEYKDELSVSLAKSIGECPRKMKMGL